MVPRSYEFLYGMFYLAFVDAISEDLLKMYCCQIQVPWTILGNGFPPTRPIQARHVTQFRYQHFEHLYLNEPDRETRGIARWWPTILWAVADDKFMQPVGVRLSAFPEIEGMEYSVENLGSVCCFLTFNKLCAPRRPPILLVVCWTGELLGDQCIFDDITIPPLLRHKALTQKTLMLS